MRGKSLLPRLLLLLLLAGSDQVFSWEFKISELSARLVDGSYLMDAQINYRFSDEVIEALQNGVPLTLEVHVQLRQKGAWIWEDDLLDLRLRYRIRYLALSSVYQVTDLQTDSQQNFVTERSALEALGEISGFPLIAADRLERGQSYQLLLRTSLDIDALPIPLRPIAYLTSAWKLDSEWSTWPIQP